MSPSPNPITAAADAPERAVVSAGMLYDEWVLAAADATLALAAWSTAPRSRKAAAYAAYAAALDAEGAAAAELAQWVTAER